MGGQRFPTFVPEDKRSLGHTIFFIPFISSKLALLRWLDVGLVHFYGTRGPFLESPSNFTDPKSNIQIEI